MQDSSGLTLVRLVVMNPFFDSVETQVRFIDGFVEQLAAFLIVLN